MNKKIFILVGLLFLLCGCTAEVNLEINNDRVKETVVINATPEGYYTMDLLPVAFRQYVPAYSKDILADAEPDQKRSGVSYYDRKQEQLVNGYKFTYSYNFKLSNYKEARTVKDGFRSSNIYEDKKEKTILLSTDSSGLLYFCDEYPYLNEVIVNIKTDYRVLESNADLVNDNVYTWEFSKDNNKKNIYILLDKSIKNDEAYVIDEDELNSAEEEADNNSSSNNPIGSNGETQDKDQEQEKKDYDSKLEEEMNKNPFLFIVLGIVLFIVIVLILAKFTKITKVK